MGLRGGAGPCHSPAPPSAFGINVTDVSNATETRPPSAASPQVLAKDLAELLVEMSVALHRRAMYPDGHPSLATAETRVMQRLGPLLEGSGSLAVGVARDQLVIDGVATDEKNHLLRGFAQRLHGHRLAGFRLLLGITAPEVAGFLTRIAQDPKTNDAEPITGPGALATPWPHIAAYRQSYDRLELLDEDEPSAGPRSLARAAQLWVELAQAAMNTDGRDRQTPADTDPEKVAGAINTRAREQAYEQVVVGYLLQIAEELRTTEGEDTALLRSRVSRLVRALSPESVHRLLDMGGNLAQRRAFLKDASEGMAVEAVLTLTVAAAEVSQQAISKPLLRLLIKLASHAKQGAQIPRANADTAFREHVGQMIDGWYLPDPTSTAYSKVLDVLTNPVQQDDSIPGITQQCEPERLVEICIEIRSATATLWEATAAMIARGDIVKLLDLIDATPADNPLPGVIRTRIATPANFAKLLESPAADTRRLEDFARRVGDAATPALLDALATSQSRAARRKLLDALVKLGDSVGPAVVSRLPGAPWYTLRNLLILLNGLSAWPPDFSPLPYATHRDVRVRREVLRMMVRRPAFRVAGITAALGDADLQLVRLGIDAMHKECPPEAIHLLVKRLSVQDLPMEAMGQGVRALATATIPEVLPFLVHLVSRRTRWLRREKLAPKSDAMLAALSVLARQWSTDAHAAKLVAKAARSGDREIRAAVPLGTPR
jgi:hypothetical protein